ncbi:MAG TPA: HAD family hydrolase [Dictyobacter sp.]|jgi:putative hydrolase of the HAD superfamily|nr:HAD family hydrolase [Dictyobacter sp.]
MQQHLLIDADDTLWENNIYFEYAIKAFIDFLNHSTLTHDEIRAIINEAERTMGYGTTSFARSLQHTYHRLAEHEVRNEDLLRIKGFASQITQHPIQLLTEVKETLAYLTSRHDLILVTKGNQDEQRLKIDNSGLGTYFRDTLIVEEKDTETYQQIITTLELDPGKSWMIGNSPRSDINPALAAGLRAVFIPHPHTWQLEVESLSNSHDEHLLILSSFAELRNHF